ncbi:glycosyltransferase family 4 protein [Natrarchaeobaculum sulfurireducens]|uniref:Glycosyltransferase n=1 Tax=Natrarchaeobaculum sulfurireducens TaxID=2044521 RepID=A0A346PF73_9EURY|nr:glycosyltransferase family 4 protein [Natrarchaeobaculum sulfurireducens]AXR78168.1 Glycosyltransferase [Natrarchaeobaculum sulfurireducens]
MDIGFVVAGSIEQTSGGYRYDRKLVSHLERRGDDVTVISVPREPQVGAEPMAIRERLDRPFDVLVQDELCYPTLVEHNPHLDAPQELVALVHLLESGRPDRVAASDGARSREQERRYLETVDAAIATSEYTASRTTDLTALPTIVAPPAGRREEAAVSPTAVDQRASAIPLRLAFVGNVVERKNLPALLEAVARFDRDCVCEWELIVVGNTDADPAAARIARARVSEYDLDDRVSFVGTVDDDTLESILERTHVLAVPSTYEGFGMVYLEAMEYGVVPIASAVGGASEFVDDGHNGYVVDPDDVDRIALALETLVTDRDRLASLARRALETADAHPTWAETTETVRAFLETDR